MKILLLLIMLLMTTPTYGAYVNAPSGLRVREEPNTDSKVLKVLPFGSEVEGEEDKGWIKTEAGYVCAEFVQEHNPLGDMEYLGEWHITAYAYTGSPCANGRYPTEGYTVACNALPFGTEIYIDGVGFRTVEDTDDGSMGLQWCDVYMTNVSDCIQWGSQYRRVWKVE